MNEKKVVGEKEIPELVNGLNDSLDTLYDKIDVLEIDRVEL